MRPEPELLRVRDGRVSFSLDNRSWWNSRDLARFFAAGLKALKVFKRRDIIVVSSPIRSRGCAQIGGRGITIAIATPSRFELRRLARLFEHEVAHTNGLYHEDMSYSVLWSLGPTPAWAKLRLRWERP